MNSFCTNTYEGIKWRNLICHVCRPYQFFYLNPHLYLFFVQLNLFAQMIFSNVNNFLEMQMKFRLRTNTQNFQWKFQHQTLTFFMHVSIASVLVMCMCAMNHAARREKEPSKWDKISIHRKKKHLYLFRINLNCYGQPWRGTH